MSKQPLLVTTAHKGVFFGYGTPSIDDTIILENAQMCVYWDSACRGVFGLATKGPGKQCRVGPIAPKLWLRDVTAILEVSTEAEQKWISQPWN